MHPLAQYSFEDFDKHNCLKLSFSFYFMLIFLLRGYAMGILSLSNMRDKLSLIQWFYPESTAFYLSLVTGIPGLLLFVLLLARRPAASEWLKSLWPKFLLLGTIAVFIDLSFYWAQFFILQQGKLSWLIAQSVIGGTLLLLMKTSHRATINLAEFPEEIEEKPKNRRKNDRC
ncbi:hypothetical protein A9Q98_01845 [Thalassotalea sp. 42_200_T64]|nr:hypothetical protein A9Q98_01845 [Thalassotalea sp. 42_200_T64]